MKALLCVSARPVLSPSRKRPARTRCPIAPSPDIGATGRMPTVPQGPSHAVQLSGVNVPRKIAEWEACSRGTDSAREGASEPCTRPVRTAIPDSQAQQVSRESPPRQDDREQNTVVASVRATASPPVTPPKPFLHHDVAAMHPVPAPPPPPPPPPPKPNLAASSSVSGNSQPRAVSSRLLRWSVIRDEEAGKGTLWAKLRDTGTLWIGNDREDQHLVLDRQTLDTLFVKPRAVTTKQSKPLAKQQVNGAGLLDRQRSTNIEIGLRRVTMPIGQIICAIMQYNSDASSGGLSEEMLSALIETLPTQDEMSALSKYASGALRSSDSKLELENLARLSVPERHGLAMTCINNVRIKLELLVLKSSFHDEVGAVQASCRTLRSAVLEVRQSEPLARILQAILHIGNYLNAGGPSSIWPASGFRLCPSINELASVKSTDNSTNLRTVLVTMMLKAHPNIIDELRSSLPTAAMAVKLNLDEMKQSTGFLAQGVQRVQQEAQRCATCAPDAGPALHTLRSIASLAVLSDRSAASTRDRDTTSDISQYENTCSSAQVTESEFGSEANFGSDFSFGLQLEDFVKTALPQLDDLRAELAETTHQYTELMQYLGEISAGDASQRSEVASTPPKASPPPPPPAPPPPPPTPAVRRAGHVRKAPGPPPTPTQLFSTIDSFTVGFVAAATELSRKAAIQATKERSDNARRERLQQLQRRRPKHNASAGDEHACLLNQIRTRRHD